VSYSKCCKCGRHPWYNHHPDIYLPEKFVNTPQQHTADQSTSAEDKKLEERRVIWHSRRGMLELDVLLLPFSQQQYAKLEEADQQRYRALLDREDPDLFTWFMEHVEPEDADMKRIVDVVLEYARTPK
jgi:antitoxin CptB